MRFDDLDVVFIFRQAPADTFSDQMFVTANPDAFVSVIAYP